MDNADTFIQSPAGPHDTVGPVPTRPSLAWLGWTARGRQRLLKVGQRGNLHADADALSCPGQQGRLSPSSPVPACPLQPRAERMRLARAEGRASAHLIGCRSWFANMGRVGLDGPCPRHPPRQTTPSAGRCPFHLPAPRPAPWQPGIQGTSATFHLREQGRDQRAILSWLAGPQFVPQQRAARSRPALSSSGGTHAAGRPLESRAERYPGATPEIVDNADTFIQSPAGPCLPGRPSPDPLELP